MSSTNNIWMPLRRLADKIREVGPVYALRLVVRRLVPPFVYDAAVLLVMDTDMPTLAAQDDPDAPIRWATEDEIGKLDELGFRHEEAQKYFDQGHRVLVYEENGEFLACNWLVTGRYEMLNWFHFTMPPGTLYGTAAYTRPDQRGKRIVSKFWKRAAAEYLKKNYSRYLAAVNALNRSSLRANAATPGTNIAGRIWYLRLLGFTVVRANDKTSFGWWTATRPYILKTETLT